MFAGAAIFEVTSSRSVQNTDSRCNATPRPAGLAELFDSFDIIAMLSRQDLLDMLGGEVISRVSRGENG